MSSNKTTNYQLHQWQPTDDFLREEFNENFGKLDEICRPVTGNYAGDGAGARTFTLGFRPSVVVVTDSAGLFFTGSYAYGGIVTAAGNTVLIAITDTGFTVNPDSNTQYKLNQNNRNYYYFALR